MPNALALKRCRKTSFRYGRIDLCSNWCKMNVSILSFDQDSNVHLIICPIYFPNSVWDLHNVALCTGLGRFRVLKLRWYSIYFILSFNISLIGQGFCWYNVPMVDGWFGLVSSPRALRPWLHEYQWPPRSICGPIKEATKTEGDLPLYIWNRVAASWVLVMI